MKTRLYVLCGVMLALALTLTASAAQPQKSKPKLAVLNFDESGISHANAAVGKRISNYTIDKLVKSEVYSVVEREVIEKILREQNFGASGHVDPTTAAQIGKIVGADFIVYGTVNKYHYSEPFTLNI